MKHRCCTCGRYGLDPTQLDCAPCQIARRNDAMIERLERKLTYANDDTEFPYTRALLNRLRWERDERTTP